MSLPMQVDSIHQNIAQKLLQSETTGDAEYEIDLHQEAQEEEQRKE